MLISPKLKNKTDGNCRKASFKQPGDGRSKHVFGVCGLLVTATGLLIT